MKEKILKWLSNYLNTPYRWLKIEIIHSLAHCEDLWLIGKTANTIAEECNVSSNIVRKVLKMLKEEDVGLFYIERLVDESDRPSRVWMLSSMDDDTKQIIDIAYNKRHVDSFFGKNKTKYRQGSTE